MGSKKWSEIKKLSKATDQDLAAALNVNQPAVSKLERADDMSLSRLRNAVEALGGELEIGVRIDGVLFPLELLEREPA
jgi:transcriptional regulator with XRE-family HTH domain